MKIACKYYNQGIFRNLESCFTISTYNCFKMRLSVSERENLRKRVKLFLGKNADITTSEVVQHFSKEGYVPRTIYNTLTRERKDLPIQDKKRTGRSTTWTPKRKQQLKRLAKRQPASSWAKIWCYPNDHMPTTSKNEA